LKELLLICGSVHSLIQGEYPHNPNLMPNIGNGFIGTVVDSDSIYMAGLYCFIRHIEIFPGAQRCRIPMPPSLNMTVVGSTIDSVELDIDNGIVKKHITMPGKKVKITNSRYAHRTITSLIVNEFVIDNSESDEDFTFSFKPEKDQIKTKDIKFESVASDLEGVATEEGLVNHAEEGDVRAKVAYSYTTHSAKDIYVPHNSVARFNFLATFRASF